MIFRGEKIRIEVEGESRSELIGATIQIEIGAHDGNALPKRVHDVTEAYLAAHPTATITAASGVNGVAENVEACQGTVKVVRGNSGLMLIVR